METIKLICKVIFITSFFHIGLITIKGGMNEIIHAKKSFHKILLKHFPKKIYISTLLSLATWFIFRNRTNDVLSIYMFMITITIIGIHNVISEYREYQKRTNNETSNAAYTFLAVVISGVLLLWIELLMKDITFYEYLHSISLSLVPLKYFFLLLASIFFVSGIIFITYGVATSIHSTFAKDVWKQPWFGILILGMVLGFITPFSYDELAKIDGLQLTATIISIPLLSIGLFKAKWVWDHFNKKE